MKHARSAVRNAVLASWCIGAISIAMPALGQLSEGPLSPGTVANDASAGVIPWGGPQDADASDDVVASAAPNGSPTQYLKATAFGFSIPSPAQITGIEVHVERRSALGTVVDSAIRIVKGGVVGATDRSLGGFWPTSDATVTYGSSADLWGETWTAADINAAGFGAAISATDGFDTAGVDHISITVHYALCATTPAVGCRTADKSILVAIDKTTDSSKDKLIWKWIKGENTSTADFADPINTAVYSLCLYAGTTNALIGDATVPDSLTLWKPISTKGFKYLDKNLNHAGTQRVILKASVVNKAKVIFKGKGDLLPDIVPPLDLPVTVQLINSDTGICWEGSFDSLDIKKNDPGKFKGKAIN